MVTERKYTLTLVQSGSYLLPSNDARTLWHIYRFEDGRSYGLDEPDRMWWACAMYRGTIEQAQAAVVRDMEDLGYISGRNWRETASYMRKRSEAIEAALSHV